jgi:5S rRNA maturation endonuclease (ribonuclease M5)
MKTLGRLTVQEFREVVEDAVEKKLIEVLVDPDAGRTLRAAIQRRLRQSLRATRRGVRGIPASEVARKYGFKW